MGQLKQKFADAALRAKEKSLHLIYTTPIEIAIGAVFVGALTGGGSYWVQSGDEGKIPIAFSEVGKTIRALESEGKPVPALTKFYATTSDYTMQVFEANNTAFETGGSNKTFGAELDYRMDRALRIHKQIPEYAAEIPGAAAAALDSVDKLVKAAQELPPVIASFEAAWEEDHRDVTKTRRWTEKECDADNKNCRDVEKSEEVYDYTVHTYTYHPQQAAQAAQLLGAFLERHPDLQVNERLILATKTDPENEYAIEKSMKKLFEGKIPTQAQALEMANKWATGSNLYTLQPTINANHGGMRSIAPQWQAALRTAKSTQYNTSSHSDPGPAEFQTANNARDYASHTHDAASRVVNGIRMAGYSAKTLETQVRDYVGITQDYKPGNADKKRDEVMQTARAIYQNNFAGGLDVQPFKWLEVMIYAGIGLLGGGLAGAGADKLINIKRRESYRMGNLLPQRNWNSNLSGSFGSRTNLFPNATDDTPATVRSKKPGNGIRL